MKNTLFVFIFAFSQIAAAADLSMCEKIHNSIEKLREGLLVDFTEVDQELVNSQWKEAYFSVFEKMALNKDDSVFELSKKEELFNNLTNKIDDYQKHDLLQVLNLYISINEKRQYQSALDEKLQNNWSCGWECVATKCSCKGLAFCCGLIGGIASIPAIVATSIYSGIKFPLILASGYGTFFAFVLGALSFIPICKASWLFACIYMPKVLISCQGQLQEDEICRECKKLNQLYEVLLQDPVFSQIFKSEALGYDLESAALIK